ncbi:MAG: phage portal protein, partial [Mameliella sp.]|nr:phage portal protein [Mameliella sp.]
QTVLPLATKVAASVGRWLSSWSGEDVVLAPDLDQVPALATERDAQWNRVAQADFLTRAEKRRMLGLPAEAEEHISD